MDAPPQLPPLSASPIGVLIAGRLVSPQPKDMVVRLDSSDKTRIEAPIGAWIEWR